MNSSLPTVLHLNGGSGTATKAHRQPITHTSEPIVTGTSVLGLKFKDGIMLAADTLASYGSMARFLDVQRLTKVGDFTIVGASGDVSDYQHVQQVLGDLMIEEYSLDDGHRYTPNQIFHYLSQLMYRRRTEMNPLWNALVVGGVHEGKHFLGFVDLRGTTFESSTIATGFGAHLAQPLLRKAVEGRENEITEAEARRILEDCLRVLYYRDARSINRFQIARVNDQGVVISEPYSLNTEWGIAHSVSGYV